jgi:hypothetical protein
VIHFLNYDWYLFFPSTPHCVSGTWLCGMFASDSHFLLHPFNQSQRWLFPSHCFGYIHTNAKLLRLLYVKLLCFDKNDRELLGYYVVWVYFNTLSIYIHSKNLFPNNLLSFICQFWLLFLIRNSLLGVESFFFAFHNSLIPA